MKKLKLLGALILLSSLMLGQTADASSLNNWRFTDYTADYYLSKDDEGVSHLKVVETFTANFPAANTNHGFYRYIPYTNQNGKNLTMSSDRYLDISVLHNGVEEQPYKIENEDWAFKVYFGDEDTYLHGKQTYQLTYEFERVATEFSEYKTKDLEGEYYSYDDEYASELITEDDEYGTTFAWQELYWDTNGTAWQVPFDKVTARVHMDAELLAQVKTEPDCYVGRSKEKGIYRCEITQLDDGFSFVTEELDEYENLSYVITFAAGTFTVPGPTQNFWPLILSLLVLIVAIVFVVFAIKYLRKNIWPKKKYQKSLFTPVQYQPLKGLTVAEANAVRLDNKPQRSSAVATLTELAVEHKVELIKGENKKWSVRILSLEGLTSWQTDTLRALARKDDLEEGETFLLKRYFTSSPEAVKAVSQVNLCVDASLKRKKLLVSDADRSKTGSILVGLSFFVVMLAFIAPTIIGAMAEDMIGEEVTGGEYYKILVLAGIISGVTTLVLYKQENKYAKYTTAGIDTSNYLLGLYEYMQLAEADRLRVLQSVEGADTSPEGVVKLYEKLLPYAIIYGLEKSWVGELNKYYEQNTDLAPTWYAGVGYLSASDFHSFDSAASGTYSSAGGFSSGGDSSGGSGGGGGGGSGGGGGGGGGGGW